MFFKNAATVNIGQMLFFCVFLFFLCAKNTGSDYRLYIMVSDLFLEKRSEKILVSMFNLFFISFILSPIIHVFLPAVARLFSLSFLSLSFFSSSYFLILFSPLFLCFCFVVILHLLSVISGFHPLFLSLDQFVFLSFCNFFQLSCTCLYSTIVHSFCLSFFLSLSPLYQQQINQVILSSHMLSCSSTMFHSLLPSCISSIVNWVALHLHCINLFSLFCLSSLSI